MKTRHTIRYALGFGLAALTPLSAQEKEAKSKLIIPTVTVIQNVHVWDGTSDTLKEGYDVLIVGDKIKKVAKDIPTSGDYEVDAVRKTSKKAAGGSATGNFLKLSVTDDQGNVEKASVKVTVIDGKGGYLTPGIIDNHQHIMLSKGTGPDDILNKQLPYTPAYNAIPQGMIMLKMGVTTIRDTGGPSVELGMAIDSGLVDGPRIYSSGAMVTCTSGHGDFGGRAPTNQKDYPGSTQWWSSAINFATLADGVPEVRGATRHALANGAHQIKIMAGGGVASLKDPLESVGYSVSEMKAAVEAAADYDTYVMAHAYTDEAVKRCIEAGVTDVVHGHLITDETAKLMAENGVWLGSLSSPFGLMEVPWFTAENRAKGKRVLDGYENVMKMAKKHGIKMGFGTDAAAGMVDTILYEFTMRSKFFTPLEMLKQATSTNAELLRLCKSRDPYKAAPLGVIEEGAWADMLIYSANPLEDIKVVTEPEKNLKLIMKGGKVYKNEIE
jgi:imidazolonepropionase-like amidohydrolase